ncbi:response regulator transcription factor [Paracoccus sp. SM22M-07]|uniref:response regulator transcription factor n=1 Tax=Paracoccus sp. SM22M-07 TaxID=1520813 RepID=UPI00091221AF|nr:response regulator transcription factor [Paracoccus sp. SM22M-07]OJH46053.1 chemotaxis protein CheY [Paracoccus sp. SM22M-07]
MTPDAHILIVEDDDDLAQTLQRSLERRGFAVSRFSSAEEMRNATMPVMPSHAVVDLKLTGDSGLTCVDYLHRLNPDMRIVALTGFASIATAVEAIKLGAAHYLTKPSGTDDILAAFERGEGDADIQPDGRPTTIKTLEWEKIHETLLATDFNISETARRLGMHRRTLARKLAKWQVR